jgi:hypothetical protein
MHKSKHFALEIDSKVNTITDYWPIIQERIDENKALNKYN